MPPNTDNPDVYRKNDLKAAATLAILSVIILVVVIVGVRLMDVKPISSEQATYVQLGTTGLVIFAGFITLLITRFWVIKKKEVAEEKEKGTNISHDSGYMD